MSEKKNGEHGPSLETMVLEESERGVSFTSSVAAAIDHINVPVDKDNKPDMDAFIRQLVHETTEIAEKALKESPKYNPSWLPGYDAIKSTLETTAGAIKDGHLTMDGKNALIQLYNSTVDQYIGQRGQSRFQAADLKDSKGSAHKLAEATSNKYLIPLIDAAKTGAELAGRIGAAVNDAIEKARRYRQTYGSAEGFAKAYAPAH